MAKTELLSELGSSYLLPEGKHLPDIVILLVLKYFLTIIFFSGGVGLLRGGLAFDQTGEWNGDLIVTTNIGFVFRVTAAGVATYVTRVSGNNLEVKLAAERYWPTEANAY